MIYVYGVMICQSERSPEILMISQTPTMGGIKTHQMGVSI